MGGLRAFQGAVAIVTGGGSGIGKALSRELAKRGCEVVLADIELADAQAAADEIRTAGAADEIPARRRPHTST